MADSSGKKRTTEWTPIVPVPTDCPFPPPREHTNRGAPLRRYLYHDRHGAALGWAYEYLDSAKNPVHLTCCWAKNPQGERMWRWLAFPEPRPLYGLMDVAGSPTIAVNGGDEVGIPVLVFPTEAEADAAREALAGVRLDPAGNAVADLPCVSWPGGLLSAMKADWAALAGWRVVIWPEYSRKRKALNATEKAAQVDPDSKPFLKALDQPGWRTAGKIAEKLTGAGCGVHVMALPEVGAEPAGWGVRSVIEQGITGSALWEYIRVRLQPFSPKASGTDKPTSQATAQVMAEAEPPSTPPPAGAGPSGAGEGWEWMRRLITNDKGLVDCRENVFLYLRNHPALKDVVWADEFSRRIMMRNPAPWVSKEGFKAREWETTDDYQLGLWLVENDRLLIKGEGTLAAAVAWAASERRFHPVREYLGGLVWDGIPRIHVWMHDFLGVKKSDYSALVGRMFLIGMVARVYRPGCMMRAMPVFEGIQNRGKSTALRVLGGEWFSDTALDLDSKDSLQNIGGVWLQEWSEMDALNRHDARRVKAFVSSPVDRFRAPYERKPADHGRQTVFGGTTNQFTDYLRDPTGATRFWPVTVEAVGPIKIEELTAVRDQLFAEAVRAFEAGERWWPTREEQAELFDPEQADRQVSDAWEEIIEEWLRANPVTQISASEILTKAIKIDPGKIPVGGGMETRVGTIMSSLGWGKIRPQKKGKRTYLYTRPANWSASAASNAESVDDGPL